MAANLGNEGEQVATPADVKEREIALVWTKKGGWAPVSDEDTQSFFGQKKPLLADADKKVRMCLVTGVFTPRGKFLRIRKMEFLKLLVDGKGIYRYVAAPERGSDELGLFRFKPRTDGTSTSVFYRGPPKGALGRCTWLPVGAGGGMWPQLEELCRIVNGIAHRTVLETETAAGAEELERRGRDED